MGASKTQPLPATPGSTRGFPATVLQLGSVTPVLSALPPRREVADWWAVRQTVSVLSLADQQVSRESTKLSPDVNSQ